MATKVQSFRRGLQGLRVQAKDLGSMLPDGTNFGWPFPDLLILGEDDPTVLTGISDPGRVVNVLAVVRIHVSHGVDGELLKLLSVPVLTGIFALGGSWFGSRLGKKTEHAQWLRNAREKAYVQFIDQAKNLLAEAQWTPQYGPERVQWGKDRILALRPTVIFLLAPDSVRELAESIHGRLMWLSGVLSSESSEWPHVKASRDAAWSELEQMAALCRKDMTRG